MAALTDPGLREYLKSGVMEVAGKPCSTMAEVVWDLSLFDCS
jgi:hypothetical protein